MLSPFWRASERTVLTEHSLCTTPCAHLVNELSQSPKKTGAVVTPIVQMGSQFGVLGYKLGFPLAPDPHSIWPMSVGTSVTWKSGRWPS